MRTTLTLAAAGAAIAATAMLTAVGTANAVGATTKLPTTLTAVDSKATITPGSADLITGTLKSGSTALAGQFVYLDRLIAGKFVPVAGDRTGGAGHVFFTVKPLATSSYQLVFRGTAKYDASHSNVVNIVVVKPKAPTTLTATAAKGTVSPSQDDLITGTLKSGSKPVAGQLVILQRLEKGKFVAVQHDKTGGAGHVFYTVEPSAPSTSFRLVYNGSSSFLKSHSNVVTILVVKAPTTLTATAAKGTITKGQSDLITGTLQTGIKAVPGAFVYLDRLINGKFVAVAGSTTGGAGHVFFTVKPSKTSTYELVFRGNTDFLSSHSNVVTIVVS